MANRGRRRKASPASPPYGSIPAVGRRILILANPIAGGGRARALAPAFAAHLTARGLAPTVYFTQRAGDAGERARSAGAEAWDALIAVGGDGTVNEVLNGMPDPSRPLGVLPVGTANVLACEYRLPRQPEAVAAVVEAGHTRRHAIGLAGDRRFLLFCGAGVDGAVVERLHAARTGTLGKHKWFGPITDVLRRWPQFHLRVRFPDGELLEDLSSVLVSRVRNYGGWLNLVRGIDPDLGLLHVLGFRHRRRRSWLWLGAEGLCGGLRSSPRLLVRTATALRIEGAAPCQIDGDLGQPAPIDLRLHPVAANLLAP